MGAWGIGHWIIVLVIVLLVFGTKRLGSVGKDLGDAVKGFKKGMADDDKPGQLKDETRNSSNDGSDSNASARNDERNQR